MLTRPLGLAYLCYPCKLFLVDLAFSSQGYEYYHIYFWLVFVAISYVYQRFDKKLDAANEVLYDKNKKKIPPDKLFYRRSTPWII